MELAPIIVPDLEEPHGLWSVHVKDHVLPVFAELLGKAGVWFNQEYLRAFFSENAGDLVTYRWPQRYPDGASVAFAALDTIGFANELLNKLREVSRQSIAGGKPDFDEFFNNYDNSQTGLKELNLSKKQYPPMHGWLRLYAVALCPTCYIITGGAIKLVDKMKERKHLLEEDRRLHQVQAWLKYNHVTDFDSFKEFISNG